MTTAPDFGAWAHPNLDIPLRGRIYSVRPPSVAAMAQVYALAVRFEVGADATPPEVQAVIDAIPDGTHPALGATYDELVEAGVDPWTLAKIGMYAVWCWARSRDYADAVATAIWSPQPESTGDAGPKVRRRGRAAPKTGPASA